MKIHVSQLGAIKEGTIDLSKRLNVFCGPNGTGKTYMAYVIYGLLKSKIFIKDKNNLAEELIKNSKTTYAIDFEMIREYRIDIIENLKNDIDGLFGISQESATLFFESIKVDFVETEQQFKESILKERIQIVLTINRINIDFVKSENSDVVELTINDKQITEEEMAHLNLFLLSSIVSLLSTYPISSTFILPVERNSIYTFSKELSIRKQEAVDHFHAMTGKGKIDKFDLLFKNTKRYPLPIKDGLIIADDLAEIKKNNSIYLEFANEIEKELFHGKVQIKSDGELNFKPDKAQKKLLPIHMTASIIKTLASLVIYLKHSAKRNDLIIIDEPEINLHPDNQVVLARLFARLINNGFRLIISTHSDYIIRELNNLIMLSSNNTEINELRSKYDYKPDEYINGADIGVYYFNYPNKMRGNKQIVVENLEISKSGFNVESVDDTIDKQNMISEELYYASKYE